MKDFLSSAPTRELPVVPGRPPAAPVPPGTGPVSGTGWQRTGTGRGHWFDRMMARLRNSPAWVAPVALLACFASAAGYVLATDPTDDVGQTSCAFKLVTGFDCPGCGGTRAFYFLLTGNVGEAARNHAVALFAAPFLVYFYVVWAAKRVFPSVRWKLPTITQTPRMFTWFLAVWGVYWVVRNLPFAPFTALYV